VIQSPVRLVLFTQTIGAPETALIARQVLDEIASLNDHVTVEEANIVLDRERAAQYGIEHYLDRMLELHRLPSENTASMDDCARVLNEAPPAPVTPIWKERNGQRHPASTLEKQEKAS
jgi:hypothetical protein